MKNSIGLSRVNYAYIALSQNEFVLLDSPITINLSKCEKALYFLCKGKKTSHGSFYEGEWFLDFGTFTHFTLFESSFVNITLDNYSWVKTTNSKVLLFIVASSTILIEYEIFDPEKETTKCYEMLEH